MTKSIELHRRLLCPGLVQDQSTNGNQKSQTINFIVKKSGTRGTRTHDGVKHRLAICALIRGLPKYWSFSKFF